MGINPMLLGRFAGALREHTEDEYLKLENMYKKLYNATDSLSVFTEGEHNEQSSLMKMFLELSSEGVDKIIKEHKGYVKTLLPKAPHEK